MSGNYHLLTYRPEPGAEVQTIRISADRDLADVLGTVQDRLFERTEEQKRVQRLHADRVLAGRK